MNTFSPRTRRIHTATTLTTNKPSINTNISSNRNTNRNHSTITNTNNITNTNRNIHTRPLQVDIHATFTPQPPSQSSQSPSYISSYEPSPTMSSTSSISTPASISDRRTRMNEIRTRVVASTPISRIHANNSTPSSRNDENRTIFPMLPTTNLSSSTRTNTRLNSTFNFINTNIDTNTNSIHDYTSTILTPSHDEYKANQPNRYTNTLPSHTSSDLSPSLLAFHSHPNIPTHEYKDDELDENDTNISTEYSSRNSLSSTNSILENLHNRVNDLQHQIDIELADIAAAREFDSDDDIQQPQPLPPIRQPIRTTYFTTPMSQFTQTFDDDIPPPLESIHTRSSTPLSPSLLDIQTQLTNIIRVRDEMRLLRSIFNNVRTIQVNLETQLDTNLSEIQSNSISNYNSRRTSISDLNSFEWLQMLVDSMFNIVNDDVQPLCTEEYMNALEKLSITTLVDTMDDW
jgi:hypothetical protein